MDATGNFISNRKIIKIKRIYGNLDEISLQKNYLRIIKYTLDYSDNSRSPTSFLMIKGERGVCIGPIYISLFKSFITSKQGLFILRKELTTKQKMGCKRFTICFIISTMRTKVVA